MTTVEPCGGNTPKLAWQPCHLCKAKKPKRKAKA